jgi:DNA uptake protein ComE-like DNA-binding protein
MKKITYLIRNYFGFSRTETLGLLFLLICTWLGITASILYEEYAYPDYETYQQDELLLDSLMTRLDAVAVRKEEKARKVKPEVRLFQFDPNKVSLDEMRQLGFPAWLATRVGRYRDKGGKFYKAEDLQKIYGMPDALFSRLKPYVKIATRKQKPAYRADKESEEREKEYPEIVTLPEEKKEEVSISLDINRADSTQLIHLPGIGGKLSSRIIKYRERLGGFHSMKQLSEVYYINELALSSLEAHAFVGNDFEISKIHINQAEFKALIAHPYIDYDICKAILKHRQVYGPFSDINELQEVYLMTPELIDKLRPYLVID